MRTTERHVTIPASDGLPLAATVFTAGEPKAWCHIASANGVKRRYYRRFAMFLAQQGFGAVTFDYRGIGDSPEEAEGTGPATMRMWGERDLDGVIQWVQAQHQGKLPQVHVGHSGGGQFLGLAPHNECVSRAVIVASQKGYWRLWSGWNQVLMWFLWHVIIPWSTKINGHFPAPNYGMGEPMPAGVALEWARWCRDEKFIVDERGRRIRKHFDAWQGSLHAIVLEDDTKFAPRRAAEELLKMYPHAATSLEVLAPEELGLEEIGHFGYFRKTCAKDWDRVVARLRT